MIDKESLRHLWVQLLSSATPFHIHPRMGQGCPYIWNDMCSTNLFHQGLKRSHQSTLPDMVPGQDKASQLEVRPSSLAGMLTVDGAVFGKLGQF